MSNFNQFKLKLISVGKELKYTFLKKLDFTKASSHYQGKNRDLKVKSLKVFYEEIVIVKNGQKYYRINCLTWVNNANCAN